MYRVLIAYDEERVRHALVHVLDWEGLGLEVVAECGDGREAYELSLSLKPDIILSDLTLPGLGGLELLHSLRKVDRELRFVGFSTDQAKSKLAMKLGAYKVLTKPSGKKSLSDTLRAVVNDIDDERRRQLDIERSTLYARAMILTLLSSPSKEEFIHHFRLELRRGSQAVLLSAKDNATPPGIRLLLPPLSFRDKTLSLGLSEGKYIAGEPFKLSYQGSPEEAVRIIIRNLTPQGRVYINGDTGSEMIASSQYRRRINMLYGNLKEASAAGDDISPVIRCLTMEEAGDVLLLLALNIERSGNKLLSETIATIKRARHPEDLTPLFSRILSSATPYSIISDMEAASDAGLTLTELQREWLRMDIQYLQETYLEATGHSYGG